MIHEQLLYAGMLLPQEFLNSRFFVILSTLVALNTTIYAALSIAKVFPKWFKTSWFRGKRARAETRSIFPDARR